MTNQEQVRRFGDESIPMIDRIAIMNPSLALYGLRARAGFAAKRPGIVVESVSSYAKLASGMARAKVISADALRQDGNTLREILKDAESMPGADAPRIAEVRAEIAALLPTS